MARRDLGPRASRVPAPVPGCTFSVCVCGRALLSPVSQPKSDTREVSQSTAHRSPKLPYVYLTVHYPERLPASQLQLPLAFHTSHMPRDPSKSKSKRIQNTRTEGGLFSSWRWRCEQRHANGTPFFYFFPSTRVLIAHGGTDAHINAVNPLECLLEQPMCNPTADFLVAKGPLEYFNGPLQQQADFTFPVELGLAGSSNIALPKLEENSRRLHGKRWIDRTLKTICEACSMSNCIFPLRSMAADV